MGVLSMLICLDWLMLEAKRFETNRKLCAQNRLITSYLCNSQNDTRLVKTRHECKFRFLGIGWSGKKPNRSIEHLQRSTLFLFVLERTSLWSMTFVVSYVNDVLWFLKWWSYQFFKCPTTNEINHLTGRRFLPINANIVQFNINSSAVAATFLLAI